MDISLHGHKQPMAQTGAAETSLPAEVGGAPERATPSQGTPNLIITETPTPPTQPGAIPEDVLGKSMVRDDAVGKVVNRALEKVPTGSVEKAIAMILQSEYETAKATIDNMKPSEREREMQKESLQRDARKADEQRYEKVSAEQLRSQMTVDLPPGEEGLAKTFLDRIPVRV